MWIHIAMIQMEIQMDTLRFSVCHDRGVSPHVGQTNIDHTRKSGVQQKPGHSLIPANKKAFLEISSGKVALLQIVWELSFFFS